MPEPTEPNPSPDSDGPLRRPPPPQTWRERIEGLADATGTTPARLAVGVVGSAVLVAVGLWVLRPPPAPPEVSLPYASTTSSLPSTTEPVGLVVHVAGAVAAPGVHELPADARVVDAVEAAGGLATDADPARLNLAAPLSDGERVYVLARGEEAPPTAPGTATVGPSSSGTGPVDLNTADAAALDTLPGVGPATAAAIIEHRAKVGRFSSVDQLLDVPGIGEAKLEALRDLVTV